MNDWLLCLWSTVTFVCSGESPWFYPTFHSVCGKFRAKWYVKPLDLAWENPCACGFQHDLVRMGATRARLNEIWLKLVITCTTYWGTFVKNLNWIGRWSRENDAQKQSGLTFLAHSVETKFRKDMQLWGTLDDIENLLRPGPGPGGPDCLLKVRVRDPGWIRTAQCTSQKFFPN